MKGKDLQIVLAGLVIGAALGLFLYVLFGFGLTGRGSGALPAGRALEFSPEVGNPAPEFELENLSGEPVQLLEQRGKPVLINFWATWCGPCRLEMPEIQARYEQHAGELAVLAVNFDEPAEVVQPFVEGLGLTFEVLLDPGGEVQELYRVRGYPTTYIVDAGGIVQVVHIGLMTGEQLDRYLGQVGVGE